MARRGENGIAKVMYRAEIKGVDEDAGTVTAIVSTETPDRDGDIIRQSKWDKSNFDKHPALLADHNYGDIRSQIGEWTETKVVGGKNPRLEGTAKYYIGEGNEKADWAFSLAKKGMAAFSVGFIPDMDKATLLDENGSKFFGPFEFNGQELLEISQVTIPAHPEALQRMKGLSHDPIVDALIDEMLEGVEMKSNADEMLDLLKSLDARLKGIEERLNDEPDNNLATRESQTIEADPFDFRQLINEGINEALGR